jgi:hypothetical protein
VEFFSRAKERNTELNNAVDEGNSKKLQKQARKIQTNKDTSYSHCIDEVLIRDLGCCEWLLI